MDSVRKTPTALRLTDQKGCNIVEITSAKGNRIGHVILGGPGPTLLVAGTRQEIRSVFQRVLLHPALRSLKGKLILLFLDQLDHGETQQALEHVAKRVKPITATLFLEAPSNDATVSQRSSDVLIDTIFRFCEKHGLTRPSDGPEALNPSDFAS